MRPKVLAQATSRAYGMLSTCGPVAVQMRAVRRGTGVDDPSDVLRQGMSVRPKTTRRMVAVVLAAMVVVVIVAALL
jgi:hypothetical protein